MFDLINYEPKYYEAVSALWTAQGWPVLPEISLPTNGLLVKHEDKPVCFGWLYLTDSNMSLTEWVVADPEVSYELRGKCLDLLIDGLKQRSYAEGRTLIFTTVTNARLMARYEKHGYNITDREVTNMLCNLNEGV